MNVIQRISYKLDAPRIRRHCNKHKECGKCPMMKYSKRCELWGSEFENVPMCNTTKKPCYMGLECNCLGCEYDI